MRRRPSLLLPAPSHASSHAGAFILFCIGWGLAFLVQAVRDKLSARTWSDAVVAQTEMVGVVPVGPASIVVPS
jgi:hypothetical protein